MHVRLMHSDTQWASGNQIKTRSAFQAWLLHITLRLLCDSLTAGWSPCSDAQLLSDTHPAGQWVSAVFNQHRSQHSPAVYKHGPVPCSTSSASFRLPPKLLFSPPAKSKIIEEVKGLMNWQEMTRRDTGWLLYMCVCVHTHTSLLCVHVHRYVCVHAHVCCLTPSLPTLFSEIGHLTEPGAHQLD